MKSPSVSVFINMTLTYLTVNQPLTVNESFYKPTEPIHLLANIKTFPTTDKKNTAFFLLVKFLSVMV